MSKKDTTAEIIDNVLRIALLTGVFSMALAAPNSVKAFEKPLNKILKHLTISPGNENCAA